MSDKPIIRIKREGQPVQEFTVERRLEDYKAGMVVLEVRPAYIQRALAAIRRIGRLSTPAGSR